jgi:hypothetical protein
MHHIEQNKTLPHPTINMDYKALKKEEVLFWHI